ncbi:unnamed protein product [Rhodiola kirilowii]
MKLSLKIRDDPQHKTPLIKAKIPITVLTLPFISGFVAGDSSDLSFNLTTNFPSCPSLRFSYSPNPQNVNHPPLSVTLKSGVGVFGSPRDSPLVISADLNLFNDRNPSFMLQIKPRFGHFSVHKTACSNPSSKSSLVSNLGAGDEPALVGWSNIDIESGGRGDKYRNGKGSESFGFGMDMPVTWRDLKMDSLGEKDGILSGFKVRARSELPLTSKLMVNFRWGANFPADVRKQLPFLTVDKIGIQRVEGVKENKKVEKVECGAGEVEKLSGMYSWLRRDLEELQRENRGLRRSLEEIKAGGAVRNHLFEEKKSTQKPVAAQTYDTRISDSRTKRNGVDMSVHKDKDAKKPVDKGGSLEDELQRAIKAASAS